ncbi:hypothetical protein [Clostridium pasteurianum]|uniref:Uncharacterized protein n=1 Tax=Clostridium pasteurianum BC1 TaxID=86416 RepID=R4KD85_CLOPA|nr:hypothetical protein [Clostridium pasteurianum]AGK97575.1 hypothetical protein Clopa_2730 [Clostridium pasteurianum BC1]
MKKFTTRTYRSKEQFIKASKKLEKKGYKVLNVSEVDRKHVVEYQTKP